MEMILIRHGEPDYSPCEKRGFIGQGHDLAPLTPQGVAQARAVAESPLLEGAELLVSSTGVWWLVPRRGEMVTLPLPSWYMTNM